MENVLLHSCCAPCSAAIVEWMLAQDIRPTLYYFNPNIFPQEEYEIRKSECSRYAQKLGFREWGREPHAFKLKDGSYRDEIQMVLFLS